MSEEERCAVADAKWLTNPNIPSEDEVNAAPINTENKQENEKDQ